MRTLLAVVLAAAVAVPALAADPENGTISPSSPKTAWKGSVEASSVGYTLYTVAGQNPSESCEQPYCDTFTLKLEGTTANVALMAKTEGVNEIDIALDKDGEVTTFSGDDMAKGTVKNLPPGEYKIYVWGVKGASSGSIAFDYEATAEIAGATGGTPPPTTGTSPTTQPAPQPTQPVSQPDTPTKLSVKAKKTSARKANKRKRLVVDLSTSRGLKNVVVSLKRGRKTVGTAKLAGFQGSGTVAIRLKGKLKKGKHSILVRATDDGGRPVSAKGSVKIVK